MFNPRNEPASGARQAAGLVCAIVLAMMALGVTSPARADDPKAAQPAAAAEPSSRVPGFAPIRHLSMKARERALELLRKQDPMERMNRWTYRFNDVFDRALARPVARGYRALVPIPVRKAVSNFIANLEYPTVIVNDVLQGKLSDAGRDTLRLVVNSVAGIGGLGDPATHLGLISHDEDFGQTLGRWGVGPGPYVVLPFLGPSDLRDAPGRYVSRYTNLEYYVNSTETQYALIGLSLLDRRADLLSADETIDNAFDPYVLVRNAYLERREYLVRDGNMPEETFDDPADAPETSPPQDAPATPPAAESPASDAPLSAPEPSPPTD